MLALQRLYPLSCCVKEKENVWKICLLGVLYLWPSLLTLILRQKFVFLALLILTFILLVMFFHVLHIVCADTKLTVMNHSLQVAGLWYSGSDVQCWLHCKDSLRCGAGSIWRAESENCRSAALSCCLYETSARWVSQPLDMLKRINSFDQILITDK